MALFTKWCLDIFIYIFYKFITIKSEMKTAQKILKNVTNRNMNLKCSLRTKWVTFGNNQFMTKRTFHIHNPSIYILYLLHLLIC